MESPIFNKYFDSMTVRRSLVRVKLTNLSLCILIYLTTGWTPFKTLYTLLFSLPKLGHTFYFTVSSYKCPKSQLKFLTPCPFVFLVPTHQ